jgi:biotin operon repressor
MVKILDVVERLMKMDKLIRQKRTGNAKVFADKLNISRSHLFNHLEELKDIGIEVSYNRKMTTYEYSGEMELEIQNPLRVISRKDQLSEISGGSFCKSPSFVDSSQVYLNEFYNSVTDHLLNCDLD